MCCLFRRIAFGLLLTSSWACFGSQHKAIEAQTQIQAETQTQVTKAIPATVRHQLSQPDEYMPILDQLDFAVGSSFFRNPWVQAPATTDVRDGLGPLFNSVTCLGCHVSSARGHAPEQDKPMRHQVVRLSVAGVVTSKQAGYLPEPNYGGQLQNQSLPHMVPEGQPLIRYKPVIRHLAGGEQVALRKPELRIEDLNFGEMAGNVRTSIRIAPAMTGLGLLEAVPETQLLEFEDAQDANGDGISGRANRVWDITRQQLVMGRFGWKAEQPSVLQQASDALSADLGITSTLMPSQSCTTVQQACLEAKDGGKPEISDHLLQRIALYASNLAVPAQRNLSDETREQGQALFFAAGCQKCHRATLQTGESEFDWLSNRTIHPYTDLLLHDMGAELADNRSVFAASGREWRTPALWGIGLAKKVAPQTGFLHDGRARNVLEAILWHGGEAQHSRQQVEQMTPVERQNLLSYIKSL